MQLSEWRKNFSAKIYICNMESRKALKINALSSHVNFFKGKIKQMPYDLTYKWNLINKTNK